MGRCCATVPLVIGFTLISGIATHAEKPTGRPSELPPKMATRVRQIRLDCSHFVHEIYRKAHHPYPYASSEELYEGIDSFTRVSRPRSGDLIVWHGHVGIIVDPKESRFVSVLRSGVKTDDYRSSYWKSRGRPHFLRYVGEHTTADSIRLPDFSTYDSSD